MAEIEIHHEAGHALDRTGQKVGLLSALLAVALAIVTIFSHRSHTESIVLKSDANDRWAFYQAKRMKLHTCELGRDLTMALGPKGDLTEKAIARFTADGERYDTESQGLKEKAEASEREAERTETRALRLDLGEALLDIALVMSSLYFISRKKYFPYLGAAAGVCGVIVAVSVALI